MLRYMEDNMARRHQRETRHSPEETWAIFGLVGVSLGGNPGGFFNPDGTVRLPAWVGSCARPRLTQEELENFVYLEEGADND
jgi:hypothetical protein